MLPPAYGWQCMSHHCARHTDQDHAIGLTGLSTAQMSRVARSRPPNTRVIRHLDGTHNMGSNEHGSTSIPATRLAVRSQMLPETS